MRSTMNTTYEDAEAADDAAVAAGGGSHGPGTGNEIKYYEKDGFLWKLLIELNDNLDNCFQCLIYCQWLCLLSCCVFLTLLSWEIVGDQSGWKGSFWIPLIGLGIILLIWLIDKMQVMRIMILAKK